MTSETTSVHAEAGEHATMTKRKILFVLLALVGITCVEFFLALYMVPHHYIAVGLVNPVYILLTLCKAFYIVGYFMHLKFEKLSLIFAVIIPVMFIIALILVLTNESFHWVDLRSMI